MQTPFIEIGMFPDSFTRFAFLRRQLNKEILDRWVLFDILFLLRFDLFEFDLDPALLQDFFGRFPTESDEGRESENWI